MEFFSMVNEIRLKSTHHEKYLVAEEDEETVSQDRKGKSSKTATWNVELVQGGGFIRLKSCYGKYLTALDVPFHLGVNGRKVVQKFPTEVMDSCSIEWEPIRDGHHYKLKSRCGEYLRANGGVPPWRNSVTHDVPHRSSTQDWILWEVDILDMQVQPIGGGVANAMQVQPIGGGGVANAMQVQPIGGGVANAKEEKEAKPKDQKKQAVKAAKLLVAGVLKPKEKKGGKSKEEKTEEEEVEGEEEESGSGSESESEEEGEGEGEGEGGSPHSRFGFRKFLHTLNDALHGEEGEGEGEGGGGEGEVEFNFEFEF